MVHHPYKYADMLRKRMLRVGARCWLLNTGWTGGPYGIGKRISIRHTRAMLNAALTGALEKVEYAKDPVFGVAVPKSCPEVPSDVLEPSKSWANKRDYEKRKTGLAAAFIENFKLFANGCPAEVVAAGPKRQG
jgi:phosphoenolpyruvate carboxykinase (ATP)